MNEHATPLLEVDDLAVHFKVGRKRWLRALDGVSLSFGANTTFAVIGESGSGKSTLARAALNLLSPTRGEVRFQGSDVRRLARSDRRRMTAVFQNPHESLNPLMTIRESVAEPLGLNGSLSRSTIDSMVEESLGQLGLGSHVLHRFPHQLSGGQKQRVAIARAIVTEPELIICDEAVSALDVSIQADILNIFNDLRASTGIANLFISHDLAVVKHVADHIAVLYLGKLMELGPTRDVASRPRHPYTRALLESQPLALPGRRRRERRTLVSGEIPSPIDPPSGCRFRTRCPRAEDICATTEPVLRSVDGVSVACHFADEERAA